MNAKPTYLWTNQRDVRRAEFIRAELKRPVTAATDFAHIRRIKAELTTITRRNNR
jgi:hypothetical protein